MRFDGQYAYDITAKLSYPRMVGSDGNAKARDDIERWMREIGLTVAREDFEASTFPMGVLARWVMIVIAAPFLIGAFSLKTGHPLIALIFSLATVLFAWRAARIANSFKEFYKYGRQVHTQNVAGALRGGDSGTVVLMAHFDSKSQPFPIEFRILAYLLGALGVFSGTVWLFISSVIALWRGWQSNGDVFFIIAVIITIICASLVFNAVENKSYGALDNAAGVGVILALAKAWAADPPANLSLRVVATSAEEWGLQGAERWIEKHAVELDPSKTIFLNYDGPGSNTGNIIITSSFGLPKRQISGPELKSDFESACKELKITNARDVYIPFGASTDMMPVSNHGFKVLNIGSLTRGVHTKRDNITIIDKNELQKAGDIGLKVIERFFLRVNNP